MDADGREGCRHTSVDLVVPDILGFRIYGSDKAPRASRSFRKTEKLIISALVKEALQGRHEDGEVRTEKQIISALVKEVLQGSGHEDGKVKYMSSAVIRWLEDMQPSTAPEWDGILEHNARCYVAQYITEAFVLLLQVWPKMLFDNYAISLSAAAALPPSINDYPLHSPSRITVISAGTKLPDGTLETQTVF